MSNEIKIINTILLNKGESKNQGLTVDDKFTQTGNGYQGTTLNLTAAADTVVPVDKLTTGTYWNVKVTSLDSGASVQVGPESGGVIIPLDELDEEGEGAGGKLESSAVLRVKAIGGDAQVAYFVTEA